LHDARLPSSIQILTSTQDGEWLLGKSGLIYRHTWCRSCMVTGVATCSAVSVCSINPDAVRRREP